ncbi:hypothetical protein [Amycolatopsis sp. SID8362]|uniref:hypothetical protein n=1 Tax=Amycolatopsis sp. SID8362 TaxID=2690346 RepID=UPI00136B7819|nr:hypothetical protein [Amycolatopsis sp. SID8362]NBH05759.1 hypothetical protein [Amycolatopsis sp. SID8362]NED42457.1 hypothetical protein [Amycolatopsis sp. SID8362]
MNPSVTSSPALLAADAGATVHRLSRRVGDGELVPPAELYRVLGALRLLADDLTQLLPALQGRLEDGLLSGQVVRHGGGDAGAAWDSVGEVGRALAHAGTVALLMTKELENSQVALRDLATP